MERIRHSEGGGYPAVSVDGVRRQTPRDTGDRVTDVLGGREHYRAREQHHRGEVVVHPKHHRIRDDVLPFQVTAQIRQ